MTKKFKTIDDYISSFPKETQEILENLRKIIKEEAPEVTEGISYEIPTFYINGKYFIYFAGYKKHISLYPLHPENMPFKELNQYAFGKGTVQFQLNQPVPYELIRKVVKHKFKELKNL